MFRLLFFACLLASTGFISCKPDNKLTSFVNPFIGTDGHGHTYPGATLPFAMVQLSPDTRKDSWDGCSGYHYSDSLILGFSHTHLSGTGVGDYGDIRFTPTTGEIDIRPMIPDGNKPGYGSRFSHKNELAIPGYYKVLLDDYNIVAELTTTPRCGFHRYTFPSSNKSNIVIDLKESVVSETNLDLVIEFISDHEITGYRKSSGWAENQKVYFYAVFSRPFKEYGIASSGTIQNGADKAQGDDLQAYVRFTTDKDEAVLVKTGISAVSYEGARKNLETEIPDWDFDKTKLLAERAWERELSKIEVRGGQKDDKIKFYTALYHSLLAPNLFSDIDGSYRGNDGIIYQTNDFQVYTVFSLWDTFRALHPLMTLIQPEITVDFINTFLDIYEKRGLLPVWELAGNETFCMIGYHAVPVIVDTYVKGIKGFDPEKAFQAAKNSAEQNHFGLSSYRKWGYIPAEIEGESISKTLEYAYDDWCIAIMAKALGKEEDYKYYIQRAQYYKNLFDPETSFLRGKRNCMFTQPFDPSEVNFMLTEANTWQYTFYVPQDISGLKYLMGGDEAFEEKLDDMFTAHPEVSGRQQADITGLIGQYAHGNEPSHHMAYLYNYIGKPYKTQKIARQIMDELYGVGPDGLCGNEDCGQMSAWFVLSAMGFYPVTPGSGIYAIGSPLFPEVRIHLAEGKEFIVRSNKRSSSEIYVNSVQLNGADYFKSYLLHEDLIKGGMLHFEMTSQPNTAWAADPSLSPVSSISDYLITPVPYFASVSNSFKDSLKVELKHVDPSVKMYYTTDTLFIMERAVPYTGPINITGSGEICAEANYEGRERSKPARAFFHQIHSEWTIEIKNAFSPQYTGGGDMALIDGQMGNVNFRTGSWQGYEGVDFEVMIDLGSNRKVSHVSLNFLQDQRSWIFMPQWVEVSLSENLDDFLLADRIENVVPDNTDHPVIKEFRSEAINRKARYIKVTARNRVTCPSWHPGAGEKAWIFIDELTIE